MRERLWLTLLVPLAVACASADGDAPGADYAFRVGVVERGDVRVLIEETGVVEPERQIVVKSPISGVVRALHVREGDSVRAGQLLATVVPDIAQANTLAQLRSQVVAARITRDNAQREYERAQRLPVGTMISQAELEERRTAYEQSVNQLSSAERQLRLVERSGVVTAGDTTQVARVTAPAAGVLIRRGVEVGEAVVGGTNALGGGTELFTVADLSTLLVRVAVNEVDIGKVHAADPVTITVDAFPGDTAWGIVRLVPPAARLDERVRVFDVEIEARDGTAILRPGMTANVQITGPSREDVVRVPVEAVFLRDGQAVVYRVAAGAATRQEVVLGLSDLSAVEILDGVAAGDSIALEDPVAANERARRAVRR